MDTVRLPKNKQPSLFAFIIHFSVNIVHVLGLSDEYPQLPSTCFLRTVHSAITRRMIQYSNGDIAPLALGAMLLA